MRSDAQRITSYDSKSVPANVALIVTAQLPSMKSNFSGLAGNIVTMEKAVQQNLNGLNVPTIQYPFYLNFGREIWALTNRGISGDSLQQMVQSLTDKYESYGLTVGNLIIIASGVFNITVT